MHPILQSSQLQFRPARPLILPPKTLAIRLAIWSGLFVWAIYSMRDIAPGDVLVTVPQSLPPPVSTPEASPADIPDIVDVVALMNALDTVAAGGCEARGTLAVRIGPVGLEEASFDGTGDAECVSRMTWAQAWPRGVQVLEMERKIGG